MASGNKTRALAKWSRWLFGGVLTLTGIALLIGGVWLIALGGSYYYALAGLGLIGSGVLYVRCRIEGFYLFAAVFGITVAWAFWEVGADYWPLVPRLIAPAVLAVAACLFVPSLTNLRRIRHGAFAGAAVLGVGLVAMGVMAFLPHGVIEPEQPTARNAIAIGAPAEWRAYGHTLAANRFVGSDQINKDNVGELEVAWTYRTGIPTPDGAADSNTPIQVGNTLYGCTPFNKIYALDADNGRERWTFDSKATSPTWQRCRGVAFYDTRQQATEPCATRIVMSTIDARLIEVDARTGAACRGFGEAGQIDLKKGMGRVKPGQYYQTSSPTVAGDFIIVGGYVDDNQATGYPSGVVRAFNATTGALAWAWDIGNSGNTSEIPPDGYSRGTPNVWSTPAVDEQLGLIYLPTGNETPDFWGGQRSPATDRYSSSLVALEVGTGKEVWRYQFVHHDIWDYDTASQPSLYDFPDGKGGRVPAVIQMTKQGQIYVLDRRTGRPLIDVKERAVPRGNAVGERYSPTQPFAVGMPQIGTNTLEERDMWGATPIDQLICRIAFRRLRYDGMFTPPGTDETLQWPGFYGGMNWGGAAIDPARDYLIFNDIRMAQVVRLIPRAEAGSYTAKGGGHATYSAQLGTPYAVLVPNFMSALGVPCQAPPYGTMTAIDLRTRKIAWQVPMGTLKDTGPLGIATGMPIPVGMPTLGGPVATSGGVTFYAGTQDFYLRALDSDNGRELWKARLPVGANATPMTYVSPASKTQYVVISAGGARDSNKTGDYVIAYRLKKQTSAR